jgi:hypothetical protein
VHACCIHRCTPSRRALQPRTCITRAQVGLRIPAAAEEPRRRSCFWYLGNCGSCVCTSCSHAGARADRGTLHCSCRPRCRRCSSHQRTFLMEVGGTGSLLSLLPCLQHCQQRVILVASAAPSALSLWRCGAVSQKYSSRLSPCPAVVQRLAHRRHRAWWRPASIPQPPHRCPPSAMAPPCGQQAIASWSGSQKRWLG